MTGEKKRAPEAIVPGSGAQPTALEARIRIRAYELFEERQGAPGDPEADWLRAEAEIIGGDTPAAK